MTDRAVIHVTVIEENAVTCRQQFPPRVTHVHRDVVLVPDDGRLRVACRVADHHRVTVLLDGLQRRILNDARIAAGNYTQRQQQQQQIYTLRISLALQTYPDRFFTANRFFGRPFLCRSVAGDIRSIQLYSPYRQPHTTKKEAIHSKQYDEKVNNSVTMFNTFELVT